MNTWYCSFPGCRRYCWAHVPEDRRFLTDSGWCFMNDYIKAICPDHVKQMESIRLWLNYTTP